MRQEKFSPPRNTRIDQNHCNPKNGVHPPQEGWNHSRLKEAGTDYRFSAFFSHLPLS